MYHDMKSSQPAHTIQTTALNAVHPQEVEYPDYSKAGTETTTHLVRADLRIYLLAILLFVHMYSCIDTF